MSRITLLAVLALLALPSVAGAQKRDLYVSLGDSWAMSVQSSPTNVLRFSDRGYVEQLLRQQRARGKRWRLVQFGCAGTTTEEMIRGNPADDGSCTGHRPRYRNRSASTSQLATAERHLRRNRARVALVTVIVSGNDLYACAPRGNVDFACLDRELAEIEVNVGTIARRLRAAAGRKVKIVALGYPNIFLYYWTDPDKRFVAEASQGVYKDRWMPNLRAGYRRGDIRFIDLADTFGSYGSLATADVNLPPYGMVPRAVATICRETWFCQHQDIHPKTAGYRRIASAIRQSLR